jgi:hypothetical protein
MPHKMLIFKAEMVFLNFIDPRNRFQEIDFQAMDSARQGIDSWAS